jgi:hypothetical protein
MKRPLQDYFAKQVSKDVHPAIKMLAAHILKQHSGVHAVIAYGSALRDSNPENTLVDFYVLTETIAGVSHNPVSRFLCGVVPPNVYYVEHQNYRAKYAVLPMELLSQKVSGKTANPYFWARFCQPMRLVFSQDDIARKRMVQILEKAALTAYSEARRLASRESAEKQWTMLFRETYQTELRPEDASRADAIVAAQKDHFEMVSKLATVVETSEISWPTRHKLGKILSVLRLVKAAFTFQGGADYAAWKIKRHSGVQIEVKPWHRKHPLLASIVLLPKLLKSRGLK